LFLPDGALLKKPWVGIDRNALSKSGLNTPGRTPTKTAGINLSNGNVELFDPLADAPALLPALIIELSRTRRTVMGPLRGRIELDGVLARCDGMPEKNVQTALLQFLYQQLILGVRKTRREQQDPSQQTPNFSIEKMHFKKMNDGFYF
jgi:hypothetical protein